RTIAWHLYRGETHVTPSHPLTRASACDGMHCTSSRFNTSRSITQIPCGWASLIRLVVRSITPANTDNCCDIRKDDRAMPNTMTPSRRRSWRSILAATTSIARSRPLDQHFAPLRPEALFVVPPSGGLSEEPPEGGTPTKTALFVGVPPSGGLWTRN